METPRDANRHPHHAKPPQVVQEKAKLTTDLQRLRKHYLSYGPTLKDLQKKYEVAMKEKMCWSVSGFRPSRCVFVSTASRRHDLRQRAREARGPVAAMAWGA